MSEELIKCPKCSSTQISAQKKGFSAGKAAAGAVLTGGIGILAGTIGSGKVEVHCLSCGNTWKPGEHNKPKIDETKPLSTGGWIGIIIALAIVAYVIFDIASR